MNGDKHIKPRTAALDLAATADLHKAINVRILEVSQLCGYTDYFILMSGASNRQTRALADKIMEKTGLPPSAAEGYQKGDWILLDLGDMVVHVFHEPIRKIYNLDKLWGDAPIVSPGRKKSKREETLKTSSTA